MVMTLGDLHSKLTALTAVHGRDIKVIAVDGNNGIELGEISVFARTYDEDESDEAGVLEDNLVLGEKYISLQVE